MCKPNYDREYEMHSCHGYTLMETLIVIAIMLLIGGASANFINVSMNANKKAFGNYSVAIQLLSIDHFIRRTCDDVHIPYWDASDAYIPSIVEGIAKSKYTYEIQSIKPLFDSKSVIRGLRVTYSVNGIEAMTDALFASVPVMESP